MHEKPKRNRYAKGKRRINPAWSPEKAAPPSRRKKSLLDIEDSPASTRAYVR